MVLAMSETTTIEIEVELRDWLREEREPPESSYSDTLRRLKGDVDDAPCWTEAEIEDIAERVSERQLREARR
jgi:hypothetical protein